MDTSIIQFNGTNCKNCYKCIRYCEVKAIKFSQEQARILDQECILCGKCALVCPQNAKQLFCDVEQVKASLRRGEKVYASLAPSYMSAFAGAGFSRLSAALKELGFAGVEETAIGATLVSQELSRLLEQKRMKNLITTCCPTINLLVEKYYPSLVPYLAPVVAPATAHARLLRKAYGQDCRVVFIGPCISKKHEAQSLGEIDYVLLFDQLRDWMEEQNITLDQTDPSPSEMHHTISRLYPTPGGILQTVPQPPQAAYQVFSVDGINRCINILNSLQEQQVQGYFLEMSACAGSCMEGPGIQRFRSASLPAKSELMSATAKPTLTPLPSTESIALDLSVSWNHTRVRPGQPTEEDIQRIYREIGKNSEEALLNCGACGYNTCREKAVAVYQDKADLHMCLPYLRERAESMSNLILDNTPNGVFLVDQNLDVMEYNRAAQRMFSLVAAEVVGLPLQFVLNPPELEKIPPGSGPVSLSTVYQDESQGMILDIVMAPTEHSGDSIVIVRDITNQEKSRREIEKIRQETIDTTQRVIDKQMRVAQEIASLLGETTGETKAALSKLKHSILSEEAGQ